MKRTLIALSFSVLSTIFIFTIYVSADTFYVDPTYVGLSDGSEISPYKSWSEVEFINGSIYLQKKGTKDVLNKSIKPASNCIMGAYGSGNTPQIYNEVSKPNKAVDISNCMNVTVMDLNIQAPNASSCINIAGMASGNITINGCVVSNSEWGIRLYHPWANAKILNTEVYNTRDDGIYAEDIRNLEIANCYVHDVNQNYVLVSTDSYYSAGDCVQLNRCNNFQIHNNLLDHSATGNKFAFIAHGSGTETGMVENNHLIGQRLGPDGGAVIYLGPQMGVVTIRNNVLENGFFAVYTTANNMLFYNNVVNNNDAGISFCQQSSTDPQTLSGAVYNNTFYNSRVNIFHSGKVSGKNTQLIVANNIFDVSYDNNKVYNFQTAVDTTMLISSNNIVSEEKADFILSGALKYSTLQSWKNYNFDINSLVGSKQLFKDASNGNFEVVQGSNAIGTGKYIDGITGNSPVNIGAELLNTDISINGQEKLKPKYFDATLTKDDVVFSENSWESATNNLGTGHSGTQIIQFDVTPLEENLNSVIGYTDSSTTVDGYSDLNMALRLSSNNVFDVLNGTEYSADFKYSYKIGVTYRVEIIAYLDSNKYDVWITSSSSIPVKIASDYSFRNVAPTMYNVGKVIVKADSVTTIKKCILTNHVITNYNANNSLELNAVRFIKDLVDITEDGISSGGITCNAYVKNKFLDVKVITVSFALFDSNNKLVSLGTKTDNIAPSTTKKFSSILTVPTTDNVGYYIKMLVWDFGNLKPYIQKIWFNNYGLWM